jgi:hypothetical protein
MPIITFSEKDILRGKIVSPAWYRVRIDSSGENLAKSGTSTNYPMEGTILFNADNGSKDFAGVPTPSSWLFNSGAIGFMVGFFAALGVEIKPGTRVDLNATVGKEIDIFMENDTYEGRLVNKINHKYRTPRSEVASA